MVQPMRIFVSTLTEPPRYYASCSYRERGGPGRVEITGKKWDVTEEIEAIIQQRKDSESQP